MINGRNPFLKSFITSCFLLICLAQVHEQSKLCQIGCLEIHVDDWQPDPATAFIHSHSEK